MKGVKMCFKLYNLMLHPANMTTTTVDENNVTVDDITDDTVTNRCMFNCQFGNQIRTLHYGCSQYLF